MTIRQVTRVEERGARGRTPRTKIRFRGKRNSMSFNKDD